MAKSESESAYVTVQIYDQTYHLSGQDLPQIRSLAARVDERMRAVAAHGRTADSLRVAVLAALNLAEELGRAEEKLQAISGAQEASELAGLKIRAINLRGLLDEVLVDEAADDPAQTR
jgi:cell division protein ZapA